MHIHVTQKNNRDVHY